MWWWIFHIMAEKVLDEVQNPPLGLDAFLHLQVNTLKLKP